MSRIIDWLEDYYIYVVMFAVIAIFAFGGIVSRCDKDSNEIVREQTWEKRKVRDENRAAFYEKYCTELTQFASAMDFSIWLDEADVPSFALLHDYVMAKYGDYTDEDGYINLVDYLGYEYK